MGIAVVLPVGVHHSRRLRQPVLALMMVGDDEIDSQLPTQLRFRYCSNAAVYGNNQRNLLLRQKTDGHGV